MTDRPRLTRKQIAALKQRTGKSLWTLVRSGLVTVQWGCLYLTPAGAKALTEAAERQ